MWHYGTGMATNTPNLSLVRTRSEVTGSEAAVIARTAFSAGWAAARQDYACDARHPGCVEIRKGALYFAARMASGPVRFCRPCADHPAAPCPSPADPFDFGGAA